MEKYIDNRFVSRGIVALLVLAMGMLVGWSVLKADGQEPSLGGSNFETALRDTNGDSGATTTLQYLTTTGATTTLSFPTKSVESIDLNLLYWASTTGSTLVWNYQFSNNNIDWFGEDGKTVTSNILSTHGTGIHTHVWTPGVAGTSTKNVSVTPVASQYMRINFSTGAANGAVYGQAILKAIR